MSRYGMSYRMLSWVGSASFYKGLILGFIIGVVLTFLVMRGIIALNIPWMSP